MKRVITIVSLCIAIQINYAQNFKFGKVSKEELQEKVHPLDSTASAAVLYKSENISFYWTDSDGFMQERAIHERIKIYDQEGFDWATKKISLYRGAGGNKERIKSLKAYTYNFIDGKIDKEKLDKDAVYEEDYNSFIEINSITFPNIKEGCVIEYTYSIHSPFLEIDDIIFQYDIPINRSETKIGTPQYFNYDTQLNLKASFYPKFIESKGRQTRYVSGKTDYIGTGLNGSSNSTSGFSDEYEVNYISSVNDNIPALKDEPYVGSIDNYRAKMSMELSAILNKLGVAQRRYSTSWDAVSKQIMGGGVEGGSYDLVDQINRKGFFEDDLVPYLDGISSNFDKASIVQGFVKSKVKWNGFYGFSPQVGVKRAYKEGEGNVGDINLLLIAMLRSQGVEAYPVLVSTRGNGIPLFPTTKGFNYVLCLVLDSGKYALLDATSIYSSPNTLPERTLNWKGRVLKDDGTSSWVELRPKLSAKEFTSFNVKINEDMSLSGKVRKRMTGNLAMSYRDKYAGLTVESHTTAIESGKGDIEIRNMEMENGSNPALPLKMVYDYEYNNGIDELGDKVYMDPLFFLKTAENPFKLEEREYPIDFVFPFEDKYTVNIMIPSGYVVESIPKSEKLVFMEENAEFSYISKSNGNFIQFVISLKINDPIIVPSDYQNFKNFFANLVAKEKEQIVLTKVE